MNQISSWAIKNPIPIILLFVLLTLSGVTGFMGMRINNNPDIDFPLVSVTAARPGAAPAEMEVQVTRLIEDSLAGLSGVRHITSNISDGVSSTVIEFELGTDTDRATNDVRNAMTGLVRMHKARTNSRIDAAVASAMAVSRATTAQTTRSRYNDPDVDGFLIL